MKTEKKQDHISVSAVVVTWNSKRDIEFCLNSLLTQTVKLKTILIIDNASQDGTPDLIRQKFPTVELEERENNEGFARGNNIGFAKSDTNWILTLNPDACISPDFVSVLLEAAESNPKLGMIGGKLLRVNDLDAGSNGTHKSKIIDSTGIEIFKSRRVRDRGMGEEDHGQYDSDERVFGICAGAALYKREMLRDVAISGEIFPERFFAYYEDADLAWRAWRRGWEAWFIPKAVGWHRRGGSSTGSRYSRELTHRNRLWMITRNEPLSQTLSNFPTFILHEILMFLRMLRFPYLFQASFKAFSGWAGSVQERMKLMDTSSDSPPFKSGIGFEAGKIKQSVANSLSKFSG